MRPSQPAIGGYVRHTDTDLLERRIASPRAALSVQELVNSAMQNDEGAYRALDRRLFGPMCGHFRKRFGADSASHDELARQAISEALQAVATGRYDPRKASFVTFLYAVARNIGLRFLSERGKQRARSLSGLPPDTLDGVRTVNSDGSETALPLEQIEAMRECLRTEGETYSLTPEERFVVAGRAQGKTFETLSAQLGRALDTVHRRSLRAIAKLRQCLKNKGYNDE